MSITHHKFKHREVQDLAWVITSPPLVSGNINGVNWWSHKTCLAEYQDCLPFLLKLDSNPDPLLAHLAQVNSGRLGLRFEAFIAFWLDLSPNYTLLAQNIQIIKDKRTLGELDFIIRDNKRDCNIHLEVAVKFYLGCPPLDDPFNWYGTNTNDQLGKKIGHLKNHQTQISRQHHDYLTDHYQLKIDQRHCILKGRLFYPENRQVAPGGVNSRHVKGCWTQKKRPIKNGAYCTIRKKEWLAELDADTLKKSHYCLEMAEEEHPRCYVQVDQESYLEERRIFKLPKYFWKFKN